MVVRKALNFVIVSSSLTWSSNLMNKNVKTALQDINKALQDITLGSIQHTVIRDAGTALILSWNDHNEKDDQCDVRIELRRWYRWCNKNLD